MLKYKIRIRVNCLFNKCVLLKEVIFELILFLIVFEEYEFMYM